MEREEILLRSGWLKIWPGHSTRVEPAIGGSTGVPDVSLLHADYFGWAEFKVADCDGIFELRRRQKRWHRDFLAAGGWQAVFIVMDREGFWVIPSRAVVEGEGVRRDAGWLGGDVKLRWLEVDPFRIPSLLHDVAMRQYPARGIGRG